MDQQMQQWSAMVPMKINESMNPRQRREGITTPEMAKQLLEKVMYRFGEYLQYPQAYTELTSRKQKLQDYQKAFLDQKRKNQSQDEDVPPVGQRVIDTSALLADGMAPLIQPQAQSNTSSQQQQEDPSLAAVSMAEENQNVSASQYYRDLRTVVKSTTIRIPPPLKGDQKGKQAEITQDDLTWLKEMVMVQQQKIDEITLQKARIRILVKQDSRIKKYFEKDGVIESPEQSEQAKK